VDPYAVLGLDPNASPEEAEAVYHDLLRVHHPDLHQHAGPDALTAAAERTRALNAAIEQIRRGVPVGAGGAEEPRASGPRAEEPRASGPDLAAEVGGVPCPMCGRPYYRREHLRAHVRDAHAHLDPNPAPRPRRRRRRAPRWVRRWEFVSIWVVLPLNALAAAILAVAIAPLAHDFSLYVFAVAMAPTCMRLVNSGPRDE
jgi:hypothetical protein